jgi:hypothetical protein
MTNTLVDPPDLADYPGAPFPAGTVDAAVANLRETVGWHIAPQVTETLTVHGSNTDLLVLPTLKIVTVTAVRDVSSTTPVTLTGYRVNSKAGLLQREEGWPEGFEVVEVDLTHGLTECPKDLLPAVAWFCQRQTVDASLSSESLGSWSESYSGPMSAQSPVMGYPAEAIARYTVWTET